MTAADVVLVAMGAMAVSVLGVIGLGWRSPARMPWGRRLVWACAGLLVLFLGVSVTTHMCGAGQPMRQWALAATLWLLAAASLARPRALVVAFLLCLGGFLVLGVYYDVVVHRRDFTGNPRWAIKTARPGEAVTVTPFWHSPVTGLYAVRRSGP